PRPPPRPPRMKIPVVPTHPRPWLHLIDGETSRSDRNRCRVCGVFGVVLNLFRGFRGACTMVNRFRRTAAAAAAVIALGGGGVAWAASSASPAAAAGAIGPCTANHPGAWAHG